MSHWMHKRVHGSERGVSAVVVSITLIAIFGAGMLSVDAGSLWSSRRTEITGTDAAALDAAQYFNNGADPCDASAVTAAETHATSVLNQNHTRSLHNPTDTPDGFQVSLAAPCGSAGYIPGKVRFDGRIPANQTLSGLFGINRMRAFASSTAAWGYITGIGQGLRPIAVCDQSTLAFTSPLPAAPDAPEYPHYILWKLLNLPASDPNKISLATYDSFYGSDDTRANDPEYPMSSAGFVNGDPAHNPNRDQNRNGNRDYVNPASDARFHTVHRIKMPDPRCGDSPGNLSWVDFNGSGSTGNIGASVLKDWIANGYTGTVSLTPHDCNTANSTPADENCSARPGDVSSTDQALGTITCPRLTPATQCAYQFPVLVVERIVGTGSGAEYDHVAFLFVVMRGYSDIGANSMEFDFEFIKVQPSGVIGPADPAPNDVTMTGVQLCGVDRSVNGGDHCPF